MSAPHRTKDFWLGALRGEEAAFRAAVSEPVFAEPVPSCPDWTVRDLVVHLGTIYRRQRARVVRGVTSKPEGPEPVTVPEDDAALLPWFDEGYAALLHTLETIDPEMPAWNWTVQPQKAIFWHRRMAHETAIHRWDAQVAVGLPEPIPQALAVDGIDEVLDSWLPGGRRLGPVDRTGVIRLDASDADNRWAVRVRNEGITLLDIDSWFDAEPDAQAAAIGSASDLLLALYGRIPLSTLEIQGDPTLVSTLRTG
jgi:uncharacterized protein (TIGR03083 family)